MNSRKLFSFAILLMIAVATSALGDTNQPVASDSDYIVKLRYGNEIMLSQSAVQTLYSNAVELLESSNFNSSKSAARPQHMDIPDVQEDYRLDISGKYLLISFKEPRNIKTVGGEVSVREIVVGLNENFGRNELFTIDGEGRVVSHAKYSGAIFLKLLPIVKQIANQPNP